MNDERHVGDGSRVLFVPDEVLKELDDQLTARVLAALNRYNQSLRVHEIQRMPDSASFAAARAAGGSRFSIIAEPSGARFRDVALDSAEDLSELPAPEWSTVINVFVSTSGATGRNVFVAQTLFPSMCTLMEETAEAPGVVLSAQPMYFLDLAREPLTDSVRHTILSFVAVGVAYVPVHREVLPMKDVPKNLETLLEREELDAQRFSIDREERLVTLNAHEFVPGRLLAPGSDLSQWRVQGSQEKFYWSAVLPIAVIAARSGWKVDCSPVLELLHAVAKTSADTRRLGVKYWRTVTIFDYVNKLSEMTRQ